MQDLNRVETTAIAINVGIAQPWAMDHITALGWSAQRNPLGHALAHLLAHPNGINARLVTNLLAVQLINEKRCTHRESWDIADMALTYWHDSRCRVCKGTGVINVEQDMCKACEGTGKLKEPNDEKVRQAINVINFHLEWLDKQIQKRIKGS